MERLSAEIVTTDRVLSSISSSSFIVRSAKRVCPAHVYALTLNMIWVAVY